MSRLRVVHVCSMNSCSVSYCPPSLQSKNLDVIQRLCLDLYKQSGSARVFGYSVFRGVLNRVYGILQLKYGYSVYHFL